MPQSFRFSTSCFYWSEAFRKYGFYILLFAALSIGFSTSVLANCIVPNITDAGYLATYAAFVNAAYLGGVSLGKVLLGVLFDRLGMKKALTIALLMEIVGFVGMIFAGLQPMHILIVVGASVGCATGTIAYPLMTQAVLGNRDYGALSGMVMAVGSLGGCIAPFFSNAIYDASGSYFTAFLPAIGVTVLTIIVSLAVKTLKKPAA